MILEKEIEKAVRHLVAQSKTALKAKVNIESICSSVKTAVKNNSYSFAKSSKMVLTQGNKKRLIKKFKAFSPENVLCQVVKQVLDRNFKISYPNRNIISRMLFETLGVVKQMSGFTIVKYDFKDYFNSVSAEYVYKKYFFNRMSDRRFEEIVKNFCESSSYTFAGLQTSNAMAEIIASHFDDKIRQRFYNDGLLYYERYIDDIVLVLNRCVDQDELDNVFLAALRDVFFDVSIATKTRCKTEYNNAKQKYIGSKYLTSTFQMFDFLGYEFGLKIDNSKVTIQYGITEEKRNKYKKRLNAFIRSYNDQNSLDYHDDALLRNKIEAFSSRTVYLGKKYNNSIWKVKGFISNYGELRYLLETSSGQASLIEPQTEKFLKEVIADTFVNAGLDKNIIAGASVEQAGYNLFENMKKNKTILLVKGIGYDYNSLAKKCQSIGISIIDSKGKNRSYNSLVRDYLIKIRVGY